MTRLDFAAFLSPFVAQKRGTIDERQCASSPKKIGGNRGREKKQF